jgi:hypothetical protein
VGPVAPGRLDPGALCGLSGDRERSALAGIAGYGYGKSHHPWVLGLAAGCAGGPDGLPVAWCLATPKLGEREVVAAMLDQEGGRLGPGLVVVADKGFAGREFVMPNQGRGYRTTE